MSEIHAHPHTAKREEDGIEIEAIKNSNHY